MDGDGFIAADELKVGSVYRLHARNLVLGVFTGSYFIGIREKFGNRFLDPEYPRVDRSGTARASEEIGSIAPGIALRTSTGTVCGACGVAANFDMARPERERWLHADGTALCEKAWPTSVGNDALFAELGRFEQEFEKQERAG
jgi:hypothetical protein